MTITPFAWMVVTSIRPSQEVYTVPPLLIPSVITLEHYVKAMNAAPFGRYFLNSAVMSAGIVAGQLLICSCTAYAFARLRFPFRDQIFLLYLGTMMVPGPVTLIPSYVLVKWLGWLNTFYALIVPDLLSVSGTFLLRQFFLSLPRELEDAARIDGSSRVGVYWRIVLPLSRPALATLGLFSFLHAWNAFLWPLIVTTKPDVRTVQVGLAVFVNEFYGIQWSQLMAGSTLVVMPSIVVFLWTQRYIVRGVVLSGLKL